MEVIAMRCEQLLVDSEKSSCQCPSCHNSHPKTKSSGVGAPVYAGQRWWGRGESNPYWLEPKSTTSRSTLGDLGERRILRAKL